MTIKERRTSRLILVNGDGQVWMLRINDVDRPRWVLPGGGVEAGESWEDAARRELWEECAINDAAIGPVVATRMREHEYNGAPSLANEQYFLVRLRDQQPSTANMFDYEVADYTRQGWFTAAEIRSNPEPMYPEAIADVLDAIVAGDTADFPWTLPA